MKKNKSTVIWKTVKGYEGLYEVNNLGEVRSLKRNGNRHFGIGTYGGIVLKQISNGKYMRVSLCKDGNEKNHTIHRLVAEAFIDNPDNLPMVNHKDENPFNNKVENLEWCDAKYNTNYGTAVYRRAKAHSISDKCIRILQYTIDGIFVKEWISASAAARGLNASQGNIWSCCNGNRRQTKGFVFKYK